MASKKKKNTETDEAAQKKAKIKNIAMAVGIVILLVAGFLLGVYLKILDPKEMNEKYGIYDWPIVGEHFVRANEEEIPDEEALKQKTLEENKKLEEEKKKQSKPIKLSKEEVEKQTKEREAEEKKRVSKLARLYNEMKPEEAADILSGLDDDMVIAILQRMDESQVSQILASEKFGASKATAITKKMYTGTPKRVNNPSDEE